MVGPDACAAAWDPAQYLRFGGERARPFADLLSRVTARDPVLGWVRSTALRPVLAGLDDAAAADLTAAYAAALRTAYPRRPDGTTVLPFRRVFAVGARSS